jgi:general stress protein 26
MQFESASLEQCLLAAKDVTVKVSNCWVVTTGQRGGVHAQIVQPFFSQLDPDGWVVRFLTSGKSRKTGEIARSGRICLGYQYDTEQAYVTLSGEAHILRDPDFLKSHWQSAWNRSYPAGVSDLDATIVEARIGQIEIMNLVRRIGAAPNCSRAVTLQRGESGWVLQG